MPRPDFPNLLPKQKPDTFTIHQRDKNDLAKLLGREVQILDRYWPDWVEGIAHIIASYITTKIGSETTTIANTRLVLSTICRKSRGRFYREAVQLLTEERSAIDEQTWTMLHTLAVAVNNREDGAERILAEAARCRDAELECHQRVYPRKESFRLFCSVIRVFFVEHADENFRTWPRLKKFAHKVLELAEVDHSFDAHPERLEEYLRAELPPL